MKRPYLLKGHPVRLWVLDFGLFQVHEDGRQIGICGFLIRTSANEHILIDSGFPQKYVDDAITSSKEDCLDDFGRILRLDEENTLSSQLALAGCTLSQIDLMIQTHTHIDHVGGMHLCPQAPILMAQAERALSQPLYWGTEHQMTWPKADYILINDDRDIAPDLQVLLVPGHSPGQLAVLLELPETDEVLLTSDAISREDEPCTNFKGSWNAELAQESAKRLVKIANKRDALIVYGHDPEQWKDLSKAPFSYS